MSPRRREPPGPPGPPGRGGRPNDRPRRDGGGGGGDTGRPRFERGRPGPPDGNRPDRPWRRPRSGDGPRFERPAGDGPKPFRRAGGPHPGPRDDERGGFGFRRDGPPRDRGAEPFDRPWRGGGQRRERPPFERGGERDFERPRRPRPDFDRPPRPGGRFDRPRPAPRPWRPTQPNAPALGEDEELIAGRRPVEEAFAAGRPAIRLLVVPQRREALERIVLHATTLRIPIVEVEGGSLTSLTGFDGHQGVALVVGPRRFATVDEMLARAIELGEPAFLLVLDSLEDPQNVGSLLRSAEAAGVHGVVFPTRRQAPLSASAVKASGGATEHLLLAAVDDLPGTLADLHGRGLRILGAEADAALTARQSDLRGPVALVVGSEGQGLGPSVRRRCDAFLRIPMRGKVGSLNAAVAGSILLFEAVEQRLAGGSPAPAAEPAPETPTEPAPKPKPRAPAKARAKKPAPAPTVEVEPAAADELLPEATAAAPKRRAARKRPA